MRLKLQWSHESIPRGRDVNVGATVRQLTSAALITHNIYCEERYTSTDGRYIAVLRGGVYQPDAQLWLIDLHAHAVAPVCEHVVGFPMSTAFSDDLYFVQPAEGDRRLLMRLNFESFELDQVFDLTPCPRGRSLVGSVSPDGRFFISNCRVSRKVWGLYRADLQSGTWEVFHEHEDICNPHPQFEPSRGQDILVQHNRDCVIDEQDNIIRLVGDIGATLYVIDRDGGNKRPLPVGTPHTPPVTGHECWVGDTGRIILTTAERELHILAPGDAASTRLWTAMPFNHISASVDGRYFVTDDFANGRLYVGSIATGRILPLVDTGASCGVPQYSHCHAYMTPDNTHVIYNSDQTGLGQVWSVRVPEGFLAALDG